ncbi:MAG TPA: NADH-quinone oxidoreductase subunit NuoE [Tepidisphaeraceae bacterium]|jgi:NADH-quinone oxidoreductase subunit E|nr:NADH-quinone oxidoreductase subunit NuoE [Tepidisphaeraceae bacterium]
MAWITENRRTATVERRSEPYLTDEIKNKLAAKYFPRYPNKRAALLPTLHEIQHAYNWIPVQAMEEAAAFLEMSPAEVLDTATFYEEYWLKPKGQYLVQVCRSLSCEICESRKLTDHLIKKLSVQEGETTADGRFTLIELECLGACGTAPVMLINEVLHENLTIERVDELIAKLPKNPHDYQDPTVTWEDGDDH